MPFVDVQSYAALNGPRLHHWVIGTQLLLIFGALALATAALGMYAAFAHSVAERRQEIAVRLAVGASRQRVLLMMLLEGAMVAGRGAINGVVVATLVGWAAQSMIFGLSSPGLLVSAAAMSIVLIVAVRRDVVARRDRLAGGAEFAVANGSLSSDSPQRDQPCLRRVRS